MNHKLRKKHETRKKTKNELLKKLSVAIFALTIITISILILYCQPQSQSTQAPNSNMVKRVIDGDTFVLQNEVIIRLICIDAPEMGKTGSEEAKEFLEELILNKEVRLEKDISDRDKYGRLLRYVYVNASNKEIFINKELFQKNYAKIYPYEPDTAKCNEIEN